MKSEAQNIILNVEVNENIYECVRDFLNRNPQWNQQQVLHASMSLFLLQNHHNISSADYQACSRAYLDSICGVSSSPHHQKSSVNSDR